MGLFTCPKRVERDGYLVAFEGEIMSEDDARKRGLLAGDAKPETPKKPEQPKEPADDTGADDGAPVDPDANDDAAAEPKDDDATDAPSDDDVTGQDAPDQAPEPAKKAPAKKTTKATTTKK